MKTTRWNWAFLVFLSIFLYIYLFFRRDHAFRNLWLFLSYSHFVTVNLPHFSYSLSHSLFFLPSSHTPFLSFSLPLPFFSFLPLLIPRLSLSVFLSVPYLSPSPLLSFSHPPVHLLLFPSRFLQVFSLLIILTFSPSFSRLTSKTRLIRLSAAY